MVTYTTDSGWGRSSWSSGPWSGSINTLVPDGLAATASVGTVIVTGKALTSLTGLGATTGVGGTAYPVILAAIGGLAASIGTVSIFAYTAIADSPAESWIVLPDADAADWVGISGGVGSWSTISSAPDTDWGAIAGVVGSWVVLPAPSTSSWSQAAIPSASWTETPPEVAADWVAASSPPAYTWSEI